MFRSAVSTFRSGEHTFRSGERTFRSAEHKPNTVQRYIKTRYYANIYPTIFIHLQRVISGQRQVRGVNQCTCPSDPKFLQHGAAGHDYNFIMSSSDSPVAFIISATLKPIAFKFLAVNIIPSARPSIFAVSSTSFCTMMSSMCSS